MYTKNKINNLNLFLFFFLFLYLKKKKKLTVLMRIDPTAAKEGSRRGGDHRGWGRGGVTRQILLRKRLGTEVGVTWHH